jgi:hypothetical protein
LKSINQTVPDTVSKAEYLQVKLLVSEKPAEFSKIPYVIIFPSSVSFIDGA